MTYILIRDEQTGDLLATYVVKYGECFIALVQFRFDDSDVIRVKVQFADGSAFENAVDEAHINYRFGAYLYGWEAQTAVLIGCVIDVPTICDGLAWDLQLRRAGYNIHQAI